MRDALPTISVIIPTRNRAPLLRQTLQHLLRVAYPADRLEVIVVDDGSEDDTQRLLRAVESPFAFRSVRIPHGGPGAARNAGIKVANGDLVLFLDDDIVVPRDLLRIHAQAHAESEDLVAFGPVLFHNDGNEQPLTRWLADDHSQTVSENSAGRWPAWKLAPEANSSVARKHLISVGGFDESFYRMLENRELGIRLLKAGLRFRYVPGAVVTHHVKESVDDLFVDDAYWAGRSDMLLGRKHPAVRFGTSLFQTLFDGRPIVRMARRARWYLCTLWPSAARAISRIGNLVNSHSIRLFGWRQLFVANYLKGVRSIEPRFPELERVFGVRIPIIFYHNVTEPKPGVPLSLTTPPAEFQRQMEYLASRGFETITLNDWFGWIDRGGNLPKKPIIINFDDAYEDIYANALRVLIEKGMRATIFVVAGLMGRHNEWDRNNQCVAMSLMSQAQVKRAFEEGFEIGSHSFSHPDLRELDTAALNKEVCGSKELLEDLLGAPVPWFCYPYGRTSDVVRNAVISAGYRGAGSVLRAKTVGACDRYLLPRIMIGGGEALWSFQAKVLWGKNPIESLRERLRE